MKATNIFQKTSIVCLIAGICSFLWGSAFPCIKIGYELFSIQQNDTASQILFAGVRFTVAGVFAVILGSLTKRKLIFPKTNDLAPICVLSLFQTILQYLFFYIGLANTSGVKSSIIIGANVFVAILIAALVFKTETITLKKILGSTIGFAGIILINLSGITEGSMKLIGEGFVFLSTVAYAFSSGLMKNYSKKHDTVLLSGYQFIFGGIIMSLVGLLVGGKLRADNVKAVFMLIYLAFASAVAYSLWSMLLKYNDVSNVAVFGFMNPMFGFILSSLLLNEESEASGIRGICAIVLVCIGIFTVNYKNKRKETVA